MAEHADQDRRKHPRFNVPATASIFHDGLELGRYLVQNLSLGGALLTGDSKAPEDVVVQVLLELDDHRSIEIEARVVRHLYAFGQTTALAIAFEHADSYSEDMITEAMLDQMEMAAPESLLPQRRTR